MKKIWPWLLLLLLLIVFCIWTKKDSIHVSSNTITSHATASAVTAEKALSIDYTITQKGDHYILNGNFTNTQQQNALSDTCTAAASSLMIKDTTTNTTLTGEEAIALTNKILPHFIKHYQEGKLIYRNRKLTIYGNTNSYETQHQMQRLLNGTMLPTQDNTNVLVEKPIHFIITKDPEEISFSGTFNDEMQSNRLKVKLPNFAATHLNHAAHHVDKGAINTTEQILAYFIGQYKHGKIEYKEEVLTISGMVASEDDLNQINSLLSRSEVPIVNLTTIDEAALARAKAQEEAKRAELAAAQEAKRVQLEAEHKAQEEAKRANNAALAKAEEEKRKNYTLQREQEQSKLAVERAAKAKIAKLLQIENIEFEVAKGSLTPRGKGTVDKLANILTQYPNIKTEIAGHTDSDGSAQFNQRLSQSRVNTVKKRLVSKGISATRLTAKGYGESQPLVPNTSDANKQRNRRVEINIQGE